ncbi:hypothetical protein DM01DRAFT_1331800 [Hesseltinella vesiculosa]|uniref:TPR-like protein n=1 Tax=Hesseltinella vesiculosa TaxID=101127 RepID=A0A1X2GWG2_9FUNG|nr:hypothetical protein DM01DRAFT_1331800 [Hesseltinella vesiculosa]
MGRFQAKKNPASKQNKTKKAKEPETFDDFMEDAIGYEEQGERYASGERSQRYYERAVEMYTKAHQLKADDPDCLYNWGRVLFILMGFLPAHTTPEEKVPRLDASIDKFRRALQLTGASKTDVEFNLAQALHMRSEVLQETSDIEDAYSQSAVALQEAISLFDDVYQVQEQDYLKQKQGGHTHEDGSHDHPTEEPAAEEPDDTTKTADNKDDEQAFTTVTEMEATTTYSLIDTLASSADALTTMASMMAVYPDAKKVFQRALDKLDRAERWLLMDTDPNDKEHAKARVQINLKRGHTYCASADRAFLATNQVDAKLYEAALEPLLQVTNELDPKNVEAWCDLGDVYSRFAQAILDDTQQRGVGLDRKTTGKDVWQLFGKGTETFQQALKLEPKNLHILNKAGDVSMARAQLDLPVAEKNQVQLLKNAQFYFKQAVEVNGQVLTSGWIGWAYATWALEDWAGEDNRSQDALKILVSWVKRGGHQDLFRRLADDNDAMDGDFIDFVDQHLFEDDEDED